MFKGFCGDITKTARFELLLSCSDRGVPKQLEGAERSPRGKDEVFLLPPVRGWGEGSGCRPRGGLHQGRWEFRFLPPFLLRRVGFCDTPRSGDSRGTVCSR